jgi:ribosomal protein S18 acetylase RimI-like enzyme
MLTPDRLETYLRHAAAHSHDTEEMPPFVLFFDPHDALRYFNYAKTTIPFASDGEAPGVQEALARLVAAFEARNRLPRFEFTQEFAPGLPAILRAADFVEEARQPMMLCDADSYRFVPPPRGLSIVELTPASPPEHIRGYIEVQRQGFAEDDSATASAEEVGQMRLQLGTGSRSFVALWDGEPVGAGACTVLLDGLSELVGVATPPRLRRRGIASALTSAAVAAQLAAGAEAVFLTAEDEDAGRVYERVGFRPFATALAYAHVK